MVEERILLIILSGTHIGQSLISLAGVERGITARKMKQIGNASGENAVHRLPCHESVKSTVGKQCAPLDISRDSSPPWNSFSPWGASGDGGSLAKIGHCRAFHSSWPKESLLVLVADETPGLPVRMARF